ncbi:MAG: hypothetical protein GC155_16070 [Alphaproteobacteria bacterium]|nr:hypothetical protein [Alphaproteobacteria bacterium]
MMRPVKLLCTAAVIATCAGAAAGQTTFKARFAYDVNATPEANYAAFESIARRACRMDLLEAGSLQDKQRMETDCTSRLMADAVAATHNVKLAAVHAERTGGANADQDFAALK